GRRQRGAPRADHAADGVNRHRIESTEPSTTSCTVVEGSVHLTRLTYTPSGCWPERPPRPCHPPACSPRSFSCSAARCFHSFRLASNCRCCSEVNTDLSDATCRSRCA